MADRSPDYERIRAMAMALPPADRLAVAKALLDSRTTKADGCRGRSRRSVLRRLPDLAAIVAAVDLVAAIDRVLLRVDPDPSTGGIKINDLPAFGESIVNLARVRVAFSEPAPEAGWRYVKGQGYECVRCGWADPAQLVVLDHIRTQHSNEPAPAPEPAPVDAVCHPHTCPTCKGWDVIPCPESYCTSQDGLHTCDLRPGHPPPHRSGAKEWV